MKRATDFSVQALKEKCRTLNLAVTGSKAELIGRLMERDPEGGWMVDGEECEDGDRVASEVSGVAEAQAILMRGDQRELEIARKQAELAERELVLLRREVEWLRGAQQGEPAEGRVSRMSAASSRFKTEITAIAELLNSFHGNGDSYEAWENQVRLLKTTYELDECEIRVLVGKRLEGRAREWFHSKPEFLRLNLEELLEQMRAMFFHRPSRVALRRKFEERTWKKGETFNDYVHDKTILANRVPIASDEIIDYLIDGIPDAMLQDQARIQRFASVATLREAFEKVTLRGRTDVYKDNQQPRSARRSDSEDTERRDARRRCHFCGAATHLAADCPTKEKGMKCFECRDYGHIAVQCPRRETSSRDTCSIIKSPHGKCLKRVMIGGVEIVALIDTGSDMTLIRADKYVKLGAPPLQHSEIRFRGIGSSENITLGKFCATVEIDGSNFAADIHVISESLMRYELLIGTDVLDNAELTIREGKITIAKLNHALVSVSELPEILSVDYECEADKIDVSYITNKEHRREIEKMIDAYKPVKSCETNIKMTIVVKDDQPVYQRARRLSPLERDEVNAIVKKWLRDGIIQPSLSEYTSPIVLVRKKDGTARLCVDYRRVNKNILKDRYPLPLIEDQLDLLQNGHVFSTLDLKNGFFHVPLEKSSCKYTSFITPDGQYEFLRVPFGLCNSPAVFSKYIRAVFEQLMRAKIVLSYIDDLIVPSSNYDEGIERLRVVLETAARYGLIINWSKCRFLQTRVEYLGHVVENGTIRPSSLKTEAVLRFPEPSNVKQVQSFIGLTSYFRKFVAGYSSIARPLTNLLKANVLFSFHDKEKAAFQKLKIVLSQNPVLKLYKPNCETELHTDASKDGYGAILMQRDSEDQCFHPVYYASGKTTEAEEKYHSYELEVLAIIKALRKFRVYLLGIKFKIVTDCRAFTLTMNKRDLCVRVARWALLLEEFSYTIEHRAGKSMSHVDALSRNPVACVFTIDRSEEELLVKLKKAQQDDGEIQPIITRAKQNAIDGYIMRNGLLFKIIDDDVRLVVPKTMQSQIIKRAHEQGHFSVNKTELVIKRDYWFANMSAKIERTIHNCVECILSERKKGRQDGWLHAIDKGSVPLDTYHIDHLGPLPSTKKSYRHIFVVVDAFCKFVWFYAVKSTTTSEVISRLRKQAVIFGNPRRIIADRGTAFSSREFEEYCEQENIKHVLITTGVPRSNGQVERVNRTLIPLLTKLSVSKPNEWFRYLDIAQQYLNAIPSRSTGFSPFNLLCGTQMRLRNDPRIKELIESELVAAFQNERDEARILAKQNILKIQAENRKSYNKRRREPMRYSEDDLVAIKRTQLGPGLKLAPKYLGPYIVKKCLRNDRYIVHKIGEHEGPLQTSTAADHMKPWADESAEDSD